MQEGAGADGAPGPVLVEEKELLRRTAAGIARWLTIAVIAFWVGALVVVNGALHSSRGVLFIGIYILFASLIVSMVLYLAVMLEAATFTHRRVQFWLTVSFGNFAFLTVIQLIARGMGTPVIAMAILALLLIAAAIGILVYAFRTNRRFLFLLAVLVLLLANFVPIG